MGLFVGLIYRHEIIDEGYFDAFSSFVWICWRSVTYKRPILGNQQGQPPDEVYERVVPELSGG